MRDWGYLCVVCICGSARLKMCLCSHISISSKCRTSSKGWSSCVCRVAAVDICAALSLLKSSRLLPSFLVMRLKSWEGAWEWLTDSSEPWTEYCTQDYCTWWNNDDSLWLLCRKRSWRDYPTSSPRLSWEVSKSWRWCCSECMTVASNMNRNTNILCSYLTAATPTFISIACCINVLFDCCPSDLRCMYSYVCKYVCMYVYSLVVFSTGSLVLRWWTWSYWWKLFQRCLRTATRTSEQRYVLVHVMHVGPSYSHVNSLWMYTGIHIVRVG